MQTVLLLCASLIFYGWTDFRYLFFVLFTGVTIFAAGNLLQRIDSCKTIAHEKHAAEKSKKLVFLTVLFLNLGILAVTKYTNFVVGNINAFSGSRLSFENMIVPMGISFYTFQAVSYLIDVYRGTVPAEKSLIRFLLFTSFFPQLIQGPISRYKDLSATLYSPQPFAWHHVSRGLLRILWGFFKKLVIADRLRPFIDGVFSAGGGTDGTTVFVGMVFYVVMLYADFSGGIDITIGAAESLGIVVTENFKQPFFSTSLKVWWRRWHITMGSWFRDYVFYPVATSRFMQKLNRRNKKRFGRKTAGKISVYIATFLTWIATGIWHGAGWNYVCWGLANCLILILSEELEPAYEKLRDIFHLKNSRIFRVFQSLRTFLLICVLNLFDCVGSVKGALSAVATILTKINPAVFSDGSLLSFGLGSGDYFVVAAAFFLVLAVDFYGYRAAENEKMPDIRNRIATCALPVKLIVCYGLFLLVLVFGVYGIGYDSTQFIYNRF